MENATKALLIAGGVLISIIIISVLVVTFQKYGNVLKTYDATVNQEEITKFNTNFTKYLGQDLTIHEAITITNFAESNDVIVVNGKKTSNISEDDLAKKNTYTITIISYNDTGYIDEIQINKK